MPTREFAPTGAPCWIDLLTSDPDRSVAFYTALFGWTADEPQAEFGGYFQFRNNRVPVGGGMKTMREGMPDTWSVYLAADDATKVAEAAAAHGGRVYAEPMAVGDLGTMAMIADPGGAAVGIWEAGSFAGLTVLAEAGTPSWFELLTRDYDRSLTFYRDVFGWETAVESDTEQFRYSTQRRGEDQLAGVMDGSAFLPEGAPAVWSVYFGCDDADASVARVVELGGSVLSAAEDTPYGRLADLTDPTGARFKLIAPNASMPARPSGG